jgi:hypothetical protein
MNGFGEGMSYTVYRAQIHPLYRYRYRFTTRLLEELLNGPWDANGPAAPHKSLNAYIRAFTGFNPFDGDQAPLAQDPAIESPRIDEFMWNNIQSGTF